MCDYMCTSSVFRSFHLPWIYIADMWWTLLDHLTSLHGDHGAKDYSTNTSVPLSLSWNGQRKSVHLHLDRVLSFHENSRKHQRPFGCIFETAAVSWLQWSIFVPQLVMLRGQ